MSPSVCEVDTWEMHENKKVTCSSARDLVCRRCTYVGDSTEEPVEVPVLCDELETVKGFC